MPLAPDFKIDEAELLTRIEAEFQAAEDMVTQGSHDTERARNIKYYRGDVSEDLPKPGPGRSSYVSQDVADVVDGLVPGILEIILGEPPVTLLPRASGDDRAAKEETAACYHTVYTLNPGFMIVHDVLKNGLLEKNGYAKVRTIKDKVRVPRRIEGVPEEAVSVILSMMEGATEKARTPSTLDPSLFDVDVEVEEIKPRVVVDAIAPEDLFVSRSLTGDLAVANYIGARVRMTQSDAVAMGIDPALVDALETGPIDRDSNLSRVARSTSTNKSAEHNRANREVEMLEHFICTDIDGDGQTEKLLVHTDAKVGTILMVQEVDDHDFAGWTPIRIPQRHIGVAVADKTVPYMRAKTAASRVLFDNFFATTHPRPIIGDDNANEFTLDDYLLIRPGAPIRTAKGLPIPIYQPVPIAQYVAPVIEHLDNKQEYSTGFSRGGVAASKTSFNATATGASIVNSAQQAMQKFYARMFVEQFMARLILVVHRHLRASGVKEVPFTLDDNMKTADPSTWMPREFIHVNINLGAATREQILAFASSSMELVARIVEMQRGVNGPFVYPANVYNTVRAFLEAGGRKNVSAYISDPTIPMTPERAQALGVQPEKATPQPPVEMQIATMQAEMLRQIEEMKARARAETELMVANIKAESQMQVKQMEASFDAKLEAWKATLSHRETMREIETRPATFPSGSGLVPAQVR